jgi:hypothetical protein
VLFLLLFHFILSELSDILLFLHPDVQ